MTARTHAPSKQLVTMYDVARAAGVSQKTVSRVVNGERYVSAAVRTQVEDAIAKLDFVPDKAARQLASNRSFTVGLIFQNPNPHYIMKVQMGAYRECVAHNYHLRIDDLETLGPHVDTIARMERLLRHSRSDGYLLTAPLTDDPQILDFLESQEVPYSRIGPWLDPARSAAVRIDDAEAGRVVADLLWESGHRRIGLVNGFMEHASSVLRRDGFIAGLRKHDPQIQIPEANGRYHFNGGIEAAMVLLGGTPGLTAIFAANDDSAAGVMAAASRLGYRVPEDLSVCGFDDSWMAGSVWPPLTTIHQPIAEMAQIATALLLDVIRGKPSHVQKLDFKLMKRGTVGPPGI